MNTFCRGRASINEVLWLQQVYGAQLGFLCPANARFLDATGACLESFHDSPTRRLNSVINASIVGVSCWVLAQ